MEHNSKLSMDEVELINDPTMYRRMMGKLLYLTLTSPDLNYCVHRLTQFMEKPRLPHLHATHRVLQYLKGCPVQGFFFLMLNKSYMSKPTLILTGQLVQTQGSLSQAIVSLLGVNWFHGRPRRRKKSLEIFCEIVWLVNLFKDFKIPHPQPILLYCDSQVALHITAIPILLETRFKKD